MCRVVQRSTPNFPMRGGIERDRGAKGRDSGAGLPLRWDVLPPLSLVLNGLIGHRFLTVAAQLGESFRLAPPRAGAGPFGLETVGCGRRRESCTLTAGTGRGS